jgi:superfamily II DNA or RNA helicase
MIQILPYNETFIQIRFDDYGVEQELSDYFTFFAPGYRYMQKFKNKMWDGKIRLYNQRSKTIYKGLLTDVMKFLKNRQYEFIVDVSLKIKTDIPKAEVVGFVDSLELYGRGNPIDIREYQYDAVYQAIANERQLLLSPTASGKSLIIMAILRWYIEQDFKILIIVPTTMLVEQLFSDFADYSSHNGWDVEEHISLLYSGKERVFDKSVVISTWQSLANMMKSDAKNFELLIKQTNVGIWDEAHSYKATVVLSVMEKFVKTKYRVGTTGTIDDSKINGLTLQGLIGPIYKVTTTKELMDSGQVVQLQIESIVLNYDEITRKAYAKMTYQEEVAFLVAHEKRNKFIARLATTVKGNTLVLFNFVEKHGSVLHDLIVKQTDRPVFFIHGGVDTEERERIRLLLDTMDDAIIVANSALMSTGVNIPSIENVIFAIPSKSTIRIRQSIGRGLRLKKGKTKCTLYDIADDLSYKSYTNTTLNHLEERIKVYEKEQFAWSLRKINL